MVSNNFEFKRIEPFKMKIEYSEYTPDKIIEGLEQHIHDECEIYVNLSGDVSFMVEDNIYSIQPGSVVITKPYEYHHCIYNSNNPHGHFWILFSGKGNEDLFDLFFKREQGKVNLLNFNAKDREELFEICYNICREEKKDDLIRYAEFFRLISFLKKKGSKTVEPIENPENISAALQYINTHFTENISVKSVANAVHVSVNTLERWFEKSLKTTPSNYIKNKRLGFAVKLLSKGESVTNACLKSGFSDCSSFITLFKRTYGVTPFKYKQKAK